MHVCVYTLIRVLLLAVVAAKRKWFRHPPPQHTFSVPQAMKSCKEDLGGGGGGARLAFLYFRGRSRKSCWGEFSTLNNFRIGTSLIKSFIKSFVVINLGR